MKHTCITCGKPISGKKYCSKCYGISKLGKHPWNWGLTADDPRVAKNTEATGKTLKEMHERGELQTWITGRTKETEPILAETAKRLSEITQTQYIKKGKDKWFEERPGFIRKGRKNGEVQKQAARNTMLKSLYDGRIKLKKSANELTVIKMFKDLGHIVQDVLVDGICLPDCFLADITTFFFYDGPYYHSKPERVAKDIKQAKQLLDLGFNVLRMTEKQFNALGGSLEKLEQFIKDNLQKSEKSIEE